MSVIIVQLNEKVIKGQIEELIRGSMEETFKKLLAAVSEMFSAAKFRRCTVHFYRNLLPLTPWFKVKLAVKKVEESVEETLTHCNFPSEHWTHIRTSNVIERLNHELHRQTRMAGNFLYEQLRSDTGLIPAAPRGWYPVG